MASQSSTAHPRPSRPRETIAGAAVLALAAAAAYANSFANGFVHLDGPAIVNNPTIRSLAHLGRVLNPPVDGGVTVGGRPLVNLSFAIDYAISGIRPWSYHAVNLLVHLLAAWTLFGLARRTMEGFGGRKFFDRPFLPALGIALLWAVHPLQTEAVTYVVQRAESLMGLFYLFTLYAFARVAGGGGGFWFAAGWVSCLAGMATKEVMVSAPVMVFLYDRTFVSGSFREAWRKHRGVHAALAATWILLAWLVAGTGGNRGGTSGLGVAVPWFTYVLTQFPAVVHYLRLTVWPHPLVFFYPVRWILPGEAAPYALGVLALAAAALYAFVRGRPLGFLGAWFFAVLAPTSLVPGMSQTLAEHRMYLALAPAIAAAVTALFRAARVLGPALADAWVAGGLGAVAIAFGAVTADRNRVYRSERTVWADNVVKSPASAFSENNLGIACATAGAYDEATAHFDKALRLEPLFAEAHNNLGLALASLGHPDDAILHYRQALSIRPAYAEACANLGVALADAGRLDQAIPEFEEAIRLKPDYAAAINDLAVALASSGRTDEAIRRYRRVIELAPGNAETHYNLANALTHANRWPEAAGEYRRALRLKPDYAEARANLGAALATAGRLPEAIEEYRKALDLTPSDPDVRYNLGLALRALGRDAEAGAQFAEAERLRASAGRAAP